MKPRPQHTSVSPTVLVDIGDTLISRTVPGPCSRVEQALTAHGVDTSDPDTRLTLARCLLTGQDRGGAAAVLSDTLSLPARTTAAVHAALRRTEGQARILPGARTLLAQARQAGWNVIAVTNAAQWMPALPAALNRHVSDIVSSADVGLLKHDPEFWRRIMTPTTASMSTQPWSSVTTPAQTVPHHHRPVCARSCMPLPGPVSPRSRTGSPTPPLLQPLRWDWSRRAASGGPATPLSRHRT